MARKWLEERWEALLPALEPLGKEQEEQIRVLCEAEKEWWRQRPGMKERSLNTPMTETRNRIREVLLLREDNWWINPKSQVKEHIALKYLNFSTEEWTRITLPDKEVLQERLEQPLLLTNSEELVARGEHLLEMDTWPEVVLGIGLNTGRSLAEILKTGVFRPKTAYSVLFAGPVTVYEQMGAFFEVPTLVRSQLVLDALSRVRQMFGMQFAFVERREVGRQCAPQVGRAAYQHFGDLVPLRPGTKDLYKALFKGVYPCLAAHAYCPSWVDELEYIVTITNHRRALEATSQEERLTFAVAASLVDYVLLEGSEGDVQRKGVRLGELGVEVLEVFREAVSGEEH